MALALISDLVVASVILDDISATVVLPFEAVEKAAMAEDDIKEPPVVGVTAPRVVKLLVEFEGDPSELGEELMVILLTTEGIEECSVTAEEVGVMPAISEAASMLSMSRMRVVTCIPPPTAGTVLELAVICGRELEVNMLLPLVGLENSVKLEDGLIVVAASLIVVVVD